MMPQGNKFGRLGGGWMSTAKLRSLFEAGLTYDEIATINERSQGWRPSRSGVKRKLESLDFPPRRASHRDLLPWKIKAEHNDSMFRSMLQAESRARQGGELSPTDKKRVNRLHELLFGRGKLMVVGYHPEVGFYLTDREEFDEDIIRSPKTDLFAAEATSGARSASDDGAEDAQSRSSDTGSHTAQEQAIVPLARPERHGQSA